MGKIDHFIEKEGITYGKTNIVASWCHVKNSDGKKCVREGNDYV